MAETETLPVYVELMTMLRGLPALDMARLHALADRIGRKSEADSFGVITTLLVDTLRQQVRRKPLRHKRLA